MKMVLIGGPQRSGTTLLQTLLANALAAPVLPEAHILCDIANAYKRAKEFWHKTRFFYPTAEELLTLFNRFARQHIDDVAKSSDCGVLVLKDPNFIHVYPELRQLFPDAILIACVRDPRDIAASFMDIGQRQPVTGSPGTYQVRDIHFIANKILRAYTSLVSLPLELKVHRVAYESVVQAPEEAIQELARNTGLEIFLEKMANPVWLPAEIRHNPAWTTSLDGGKPSPARVRAFERVLQPIEIRTVERVCTRIFDPLGYERVYPRYKESKWDAFARSHVQRLIRRARLLYS